MKIEQLQHRFDLTVEELEAYRELYSGSYGVSHYRKIKDGRELINQSNDINIVTNEGLAHVLSSTLDAGTQVTTWYLSLASSNTTPAAGMTAAGPVFTEIVSGAAGVTESIRQTWTGGAVTGTTTATVDNSGSVATYTCGATGFTAYGASLFGGGTSAFGNTAGTLYSYSLFASSKPLSSTDTIDVTYTFTATDA